MGTLHKYWLVMSPYDIEKRVNEMASQGWHLKKFTWIRFTFEQDEPGSYIYRHDELERFGSTYEDEYLDFLKFSGIEQVDRSGNFVFFRKPAHEGPFELYSDKKTKISNLSKKITLLSLILLLNLFFGITGLVSISGGQHTDMLKLLLNSTNILIVMLLVGPILKLMRVRKNLKKELDVFSD